MAKQTNIIRSHRARVVAANEEVKRRPEKITIFDREALVEFYLLEDIERLYKFRLEREVAKNPDTPHGIKMKELNIELFANFINVFKSAAETAWGLIDNGNYKAVWRSIPEHQLMIASNSTKYLRKLAELANDILSSVVEESIKSAQASGILDDQLEDIEAHEENARRVLGLPSKAEQAAISQALIESVAKKEKVSGSRLNINK